MAVNAAVKKAAADAETKVKDKVAGIREDVADAMGVSRITVYNYLNAIHR